jgi:hypothetical protein
VDRSEVLELVFSAANPETGAPPPPQVAWVLFRGGTVFVAAPSDELPVGASADTLRTEAIAALTELGPVRAGTESADFAVTALDAWFAERGWWLVTYAHPAIFSVVAAEPGSTDLAVGLSARSCRDRDLEDGVVECIRDFAGTTSRHPT